MWLSRAKTPEEAKARRSALRWLGIVTLTGLLVLAGWWYSKKRIWTDGRSILITDIRTTAVEVAPQIPSAGPAPVWREVRLPRFGPNALVLLAAVALLIPLLMLLRSSEGRDLLQKCLLVSLLVHVLLAMSFSAVSVSKDVAHYVKEDLGMEIPLNLEASRLAEIQLRVRNQLSELVGLTPPPAGMGEAPRVVGLGGAVEPPRPMQLEVPQPAMSPAAANVNLDVPPVLPSAPPVETPAPAQISIAMPDVRLPVSPATAVEPPAPLTPPQPQGERAASTVYNPPPMTVESTAIPATPTDSRMLVAAPAMVPDVPNPDAATVQPTSEPLVRLPQVDLAPGASPLSDPDRPVAPAGSLFQTSRASTEQVGGAGIIAVAAGPVARPSGMGSIAAVAAPAPATMPAAFTPVPEMIGLDIKPPAIAAGRGAGTVAAAPAVIEAPQPPQAHVASTVNVPRPGNMWAGMPSPVSPLAPRGMRSMVTMTDQLHPVMPEPALPQPSPTAPDIAIALPEVATPAPVVSLPGWLGPKEMPVAESLAQRSPEARLPLVQELGGSMDTEAAVSRALAYLARNQQTDGRWTRYASDRTPYRSREDVHDVALTGLVALSMLASDHTPGKAGPYQQTITRALSYLYEVQTIRGDARNGGDMYDQAIATIALAEAAIMTGDAQYRQAAFSGADFIVRARNGQGSWRYSPMQTGDMSVTGWQVMALHSAAAAGWQMPEDVRRQALRWVDGVSSGRGRILGSYQPGTPASATMTAQAVFSRIVLGQKLTDQQVAEAGAFVTRVLPGKGEKDFYNFYCTSLMLMQIQNDAWRRWNPPMRTYLLAHQRGDGDADGSWDPDNKYSDKGGRVYSTAMATLTLEVYYRYLPMYTRHDQ